MPWTLAAPPAVLAITTAANTSSAPVTIPLWIELMAVVVAAISGALAAREHKLDLIGGICLAVAASLGGGLLRDMTLQVGDVYLLNQPYALPAAIITAAVTFLIPSIIERQDKLIAVLDIFAVGLYAATGADKALVYDFEPLIGVMMGFFTGVGGGMLRDICLGRTPYIFQRSNFYALAAIAGAITYVVLAGAGVNKVFAMVVCVAVTMGLRFISLRYNLMSPTDEDLSRMAAHVVPHRLRRGDGAMGGGRPSDERTSRTATELADRRRRTLADIERRRQAEQEHAGRKAARRAARRLHWPKH